MVVCRGCSWALGYITQTPPSSGLRYLFSQKPPSTQFCPLRGAAWVQCLVTRESQGSDPLASV